MKRALLILAFAIGLTARGELLRENFEGVRPLGMGNAFVAVADDSNAVWYNPAGLAAIRGVHFNLLDATLGVDSRDTLTRIGNALLNGDFNNLMRPDQQFTQANIRLGVTAPYFSLQFFDGLRSFYRLDNLTNLNASVDVNSNNDLGVIGGFAVPMSPYFALGASGRLFQRTGVDMHLTAADLISQLGMSQTSITSAVYDSVQKKAGLGWGFAVDIGSMITLPLPKDYPTVRIGAVVQDVGQTSFHPLGSANAPIPVPMTYHFGISAKYDLGGGGGRGRRNKATEQYLLLAADWRHAFEFSDTPLIKTLHAGIEYKISAFGFRLGLYQAYPTAGFSLEFPPHTRLVLTTFEAEQGTTLWEKGQRWYLAQLIIGFNPF